MKYTFFALSALAAFCCATLPAAYADTTPKSAKAEKGKKKDKKDKKDKKGKTDKKAPKASGAVGAYMEALTEENLWVGDKPAIDADFYVYLTSASWCGPCNAEMPHVVEQYAKMRELGTVELVLISGDRDAQSAKGFAERYNAGFPVINPRSLNGQLPPGYTQPQGIPNAIIVDCDGNVIRNGHGSMVMQWESLTVNNPDYASKSKAASTKKKAEKKKKNKKK